jgi:hypothetical protein
MNVYQFNDKAGNIYIRPANNRKQAQAIIANDFANHKDLVFMLMSVTFWRGYNK